MESPVISIIIPCFNQGAYIAEAIQSVTNQIFTDWEIIVVDNGSTDNTAEIVKKLQLTDSRIKYIRQTNKGVSAARNNGVRHSKGTYILPLDGDDIIAKEYVCEGVSYMNTHPDCTCFYCRAYMFGAQEEEWNIQYTNYKDLLTGNYIFCSSIFRRKDFDKIQGYDENLIYGYEDWDFYIRLLADGGNVFQDEKRMFFYRRHSDYSSRDNKAQKNKNSIFNYIYRKNFDIYTKYFESFQECMNVLKNTQRQLKNTQEQIDKQRNDIELLTKTLSDRDNIIRQQREELLTAISQKNELDNINRKQHEEIAFLQRKRKKKNVIIRILTFTILLTLMLLFVDLLNNISH